MIFDVKSRVLRTPSLLLKKRVSIFLYDGCLFAIFSVAVNTIVARLGSILDIDSILPHAKGHVRARTMCGTVDRRSSSCVTRT